MANETTSTSQAALVATEVISPEVIAAHLPRNVIMGLVCHDNMDGAGSNSKRYAVDSDLGVASAGSEAVDLTPTIELGQGSSVTLAPTQGVADMAVITSDTVMRRLGGTPFRTVRDVFERGTLDQRIALIGKDIRRMLKRGLQKIGQDGLDTLLAAPSTSVGTTNTDLTVLACLQAVRQAKVNQPHRPPSEWGFLLPGAAVHHLNVETLTTTGVMGGGSGSLWQSKTDWDIANRPGDEFMVNGLIGSILRYPVYEYDDEMKVTANGGTDVLGMFFSIGNPARTSESYMGETPHGVYLERHFLDFAFEFDASADWLEIILRARYIFGEISDLDAVKILADND